MHISKNVRIATEIAGVEYPVQPAMTGTPYGRGRVVPSVMIVTKNMATRGAGSPHAECAARNGVAPGSTPVHLPVGEAGCGAPRGLWGWSPPRRPAETALERRVDRFFLCSAVRCLLFVLVIIALLSVAPHLPTRERLGADAVAFLAAGGWCALNFWRCRHAHCALSGAGWLA